MLGIAVQLILNREYLCAAATLLLALEKAKPAWANAALFFMLLEMGTGFMDVRDIGRSPFHFLRASGRELAYPDGMDASPAGG